MASIHYQSNIFMLVSVGPSVCPSQKCLCMCTQACTHASRHARHFLACLGPHLSQFRSDLKDGYLRNRREMRVITMMSEHMHTSMHACYHAYRLFSSVLRPISQPNWVRSERSRYLQNQGSCQTSLSTRYDLSMQACLHARYVLACTGPYNSQIGLDQRDQNIYGIGTC